MKVIPIELIREREADPQVDIEARKRAEAIGRRLTQHIGRMSALADQAVRANSASTKVAALRGMLEPLAQAADGIAACTKGCSACCHISVTISGEEARVIGKEIGVKASEPQRLAKRGGRDEEGERYYGKPCPFLKNDACSIYQHRPLACRTQFSMDRDALLCEITSDPHGGVPYLDHMQFTMVIAKSFLRSHEDFADIREYFPKGRK